MVNFPHVMREFGDSYPTALPLLYTSTLEFVASSFEARFWRAPQDEGGILGAR